MPVIVRPATICGHSPRQRLDLTVNILTNHAVNAGKITVFGGTQMRPNLHIRDMIDLYTLLLEAPDEQVAGQIFNAAYQNYSVAETATIVREVVGQRDAGEGEHRDRHHALGRQAVVSHQLRQDPARCWASCPGTRSRTRPAT